MAKCCIVKFALQIKWPEYEAKKVARVYVHNTCDENCKLNIPSLEGNGGCS